jgi:hypothetical protein
MKTEPYVPENFPLLETTFGPSICALKKLRHLAESRDNTLMQKFYCDIIVKLCDVAAAAAPPPTQREEDHSIPLLTKGVPAWGEAEPVAWVRTLNGKIDWSEDCFSNNGTGILDCYEPEDGYAYASIPLYTHPPLPKARTAEVGGSGVTVPTNPTPAMIRAGDAAGGAAGRCGAFPVTEAIWKAMLAASPSTAAQRRTRA